MTEFQEIIKLRNKGYKQKDIAKAIGFSLRTVQRYLSTGKLPVYTRTKPSKKDPLADFQDIVDGMFNDPEIELKPRSTDIYRRLIKLGYEGSARTISRKTKELRDASKHKELYFEQEVEPGKMAEGDFTTINIPFVWGVAKKQLWVTTLKNSTGSFAESFNNQTFESFAQGTVDSFNFFGGVPEVYRLDNLSPVVKKILRSHRVTTDKFNELLAHYGFKASFCSPGKGNEKGSVESINRHFKDYLRHEMSLDKEIFKDEKEWEEYLSLKLKEYNEPKTIKIEEEKKELKSLPNNDFLCFSTEVHKVNKYGFIRLNSVRYSIPAEHRYKTLEVRFYSNKVEFFHNGKKIKEEKRAIHNKSSKNAVIDFRDHVEYMLKKPGAFTNYKHKEAFLPTDIFAQFYSEHPDNRNYLECLSLCKSNTIEEVEATISLLLNENIKPTKDEITKILYPEVTQEKYDLNSLTPLTPTLDCYDAIILKTNTGGNQCVQHLH